MQIFNHLDQFKIPNNAVVTTGTFDGVHVGHRSIINQLNQIAKDQNGASVVLTFWPHPRIVLFQDQDLKLIQTLEERVEALADAGVDYLIVHPFTKEFSRMTSLQFVKEVLVQKIGTKKLVIGYDHHFGRNREGSFEHLKEYAPVYGFDLEEIPAHNVNEVNVSSTKIREALLAGQIEIANKYLNAPFKLSGQVEKGDQIGRTLGFPTANVRPADTYKLIPAQGVYAVTVKAEGKMYKGMLNIGTRPTLEGKDLRIEVHLFNFDGNLYHKRIEVNFHRFIRKDIKFNTLEDLKLQLHLDAKSANSLL